MTSGMSRWSSLRRRNHCSKRRKLESISRPLRHPKKMTDPMLSKMLRQESRLEIALSAASSHSSRECRQVRLRPLLSLSSLCRFVTRRKEVKSRGRLSPSSLNKRRVRETSLQCSTEMECKNNKRWIRLTWYLEPISSSYVTQNLLRKLGDSVVHLPITRGMTHRSLALPSPIQKQALSL